MILVSFFFSSNDISKYCLPVIHSSACSMHKAPMSLNAEFLLGKIRRTLVRRLISWLNLSKLFVVLILRRCWSGKFKQVKASSPAVSNRSAASGYFSDKSLKHLLKKSFDNVMFYKTKPKDLAVKNITEKSSFSFYKDGFIVAGTSPKAWAFFPLIFPQFIDFNSNYVIQFLILITTYVVLDFLSLVAYAVAANKLVVWLEANPKIINAISACVLIVIAFVIAVTQRY